jgi:hypothetical protein
MFGHNKHVLLTFTVLAIVGAGLLLASNIAHAQGSAWFEAGQQLQQTAGKNGASLGDPVDPRVTIIFIIRVLLGFTAIVLVILNIYAGFTWMTAGGNEEAVTKAKTTIRNSTIGLVIVLSSYSITLFASYLARGYSYGIGGPNAASKAVGSFMQTHQGP